MSLPGENSTRPRMYRIQYAAGRWAVLGQPLDQHDDWPMVAIFKSRRSAERYVGQTVGRQWALIQGDPKGGAR